MRLAAEREAGMGVADYHPMGADEGAMGADAAAGPAVQHRYGGALPLPTSDAEASGAEAALQATRRP